MENFGVAEDEEPAEEGESDDDSFLGELLTASQTTQR